MRLIIILAITVQMSLSSGLSIEAKADDEDQTYRQIEAAILDMRFHDAQKALANFSNTPIRSAYESLIKSYEFAPPVYDPVSARIGLMKFVETESSSDAKLIDFIMLQAASSIALQRHLICNDWPGLEPTNPKRIPATSMMWSSVYLELVNVSLSTYGNNPSQRWEILSRRSKDMVGSIHRNAFTSAGSFAKDILIARHANVEPSLNESYHDYIATPIGSCLLNLAAREYKLMSNVQEVLPGFVWFQIDFTSYVLVASNEFSKEVQDKALRYFKSLDFAAVDRLMVPRIQELRERQVFSATGLVERYCKMAFTFATAQQLQSSAAYNRCIEFHTNSG